jgi:hypothetical protein
MNKMKIMKETNETAFLPMVTFLFQTNFDHMIHNYLCSVNPDLSGVFIRRFWGGDNILDCLAKKDKPAMSEVAWVSPENASGLDSIFFETPVRRLTKSMIHRLRQNNARLRVKR